MRRSDDHPMKVAFLSATILRGIHGGCTAENRVIHYSQLRSLSPPPPTPPTHPFIPSVFLMKDKHNQSHRGRKREYYIGWPCNFVAAGGGPPSPVPRALLFSFHYTMLRRVIIVLITRSKGRESTLPHPNPP